jgi:ABC-2 type transport system permease protein
VPQQITSLFQANGEVQILFAITLPVAAGIFLFRYIQSGAPSDLFHSLPLRRKHLLTVNLLTGFAMILIPIWITTAITGLVWAVLDQPAFLFDGSTIWMWGLSMSIYSLFMFMLTVAVGICIGQSVLQGLTVYALVLLPVVVWFIMSLHLQHYLLGYAFEEVGFNAEKLSLVLRVGSISILPVIRQELIIYAIFAILFIPLTYVLYAKRQVESATQAVTFKLIKPIFRFGLMFTLVLIGGGYFTKIAPRGSVGWGIFGYILGGIVGYIVAEMIIRKTWLIWSSRLLPKLILYGIIAGLILYVPIADWNGYAARVPEMSKVNSIKLGGESYTYSNGVNQKKDDAHLYSNDPEYMGAVIALHQKIVDSDLPLLDDPINTGMRNDESILINYKLDNGKVMKRKYYIPEAEFHQELKALKQSQDYKRVTFETYKLEEDALSFGIRSAISSYRKVYISNPEQVREFKALLKQDILDQTYEEQRSSWQSFAYVEMNQDSTSKDPFQPREMWNFEIKPSYDRVLAWLKENKLYDQLLVQADEIVSAQFAKQEINSPGSLQWTTPQPEYIDGNLSGNKQIATKNKEIISDLLKRQRSGYLTEKDTVYQIKLNVIRGENIYMMLKEEDLTEEMKAILVNQ